MSMEIFFEGFNTWDSQLNAIGTELVSLFNFSIGDFMIDEDGPAPDFTPGSLERFAEQVLMREEYIPIVNEFIERSGGPEQLALDIKREVTDPTNKRGAEVGREIRALVPIDSTQPLTIETDFFLWGFFLGASSSVAAFYTNSPHTQPLWEVLTRLNSSLLTIPRPDSMPTQLALRLRELTFSLWIQGEKALGR